MQNWYVASNFLACEMCWSSIYIQKVLTGLCTIYVKHELLETNSLSEYLERRNSEWEYLFIMIKIIHILAKIVQMLYSSSISSSSSSHRSECGWLLLTEEYIEVEMANKLIRTFLNFSVIHNVCAVIKVLDSQMSDSLRYQPPISGQHARRWHS